MTLVFVFVIDLQIKLININQMPPELDNFSHVGIRDFQSPELDKSAKSVDLPVKRISTKIF